MDLVVCFHWVFGLINLATNSSSSSNLLWGPLARSHRCSIYHIYIYQICINMFKLFMQVAPRSVSSTITRPVFLPPCRASACWHGQSSTMTCGTGLKTRLCVEGCRMACTLKPRITWWPHVHLLMSSRQSSLPLRSMWGGQSEFRQNL